MKNKFPYSEHLININNFCDKYNVNKMDQALLWTTYPLVRVNKFLKNLATRKDFIGKISKNTLEPFQRIIQIFNFKLSVSTIQGQRVIIDISLNYYHYQAFSYALLVEEYLPPFDIFEIKSFVDIGSNIGMASLFFLLNTNSVESALLVESNLQLINKIKTNLIHFERNQIIIENKCIHGKSNQDLQFNISHDHRNSYVELTGESQKSTIDSLTVRSVSLSDLLDKHALKEVDLLKMDIEGSEFDVLKNDAYVFKRFKYICIELHGSMEERDSFRTSIKSIGFKIYDNKIDHDLPTEILFASRLSS